MALKFLNKKGWHTGSLRNIENVWKAEQKHEGEQKKLEELRKQIHEEREKSEFRQLQEAAGLVPRQERLDFLYESGLAVGKGSTDGFKALQDQPSGGASSSAVESGSSKAAVPGALFEEKPQSANDAWRKLHSDPLLLIRQREQEALARIKNNPIRMAMIRKSIESEKKQQDKDHKQKRKKHKHDKSRSKDEVPSKPKSDHEYHNEFDGRRTRDCPTEHKPKTNSDDDEDREKARKRDRKVNRVAGRHDKASEKHGYHSSRDDNDDEYAVTGDRKDRNVARSSSDNYSSKSHSVSKNRIGGNKGRMGDTSSANHLPPTRDHTSDTRNKAIRPPSQHQTVGYNHRRVLPKMTEEEREARLREMQMDAELHEGERWKRLKKASEADALEACQTTNSRGKSFLDETQRSVYGVEKGGSATIEESIRRRTYYSQGQSAHESNAFRR